MPAASLVSTLGGRIVVRNRRWPSVIIFAEWGDPRDERTRTMELHIRASDLAKVKHCMQANQPVTVTGLNGAGIIEVVKPRHCQRASLPIASPASIAGAS
jgi:hypothetical protein